MGQEEREALARLFVENEEFKAAILSATSVEDAVRIAGEYGIDAAADDFMPKGGDRLSDEQLENVSGGFSQLGCGYGTVDMLTCNAW